MDKKNDEALNAEQTEEETAQTAEEQPDEKEVLESKIKELNDKYLRLFAEYDNYQKRSQREKTAIYADAAADTVAELLPIADSIERALSAEASSEDAAALKEGIEKIDKQIKDSFSKIGVEPIKALGEQFDPNYHNAIMHVEDESVDDNTVVEEFMKGYIYKGTKVVRHSMVKVAN